MSGRSSASPSPPIFATKLLHDTNNLHRTRGDPSMTLVSLQTVSATPRLSGPDPPFLYRHASRDLYGETSVVTKHPPIPEWKFLVSSSLENTHILSLSREGVRSTGCSGTRTYSRGQGLFCSALSELFVTLVTTTTIIREEGVGRVRVVLPIGPSRDYGVY